MAERTDGAKTTARAEQAAPDDPTTTLVVGPGEDPWSPGELQEVRDSLLADAERLRAEIADAELEIADLLKRSIGDGSEDQVDTGSKAFEREHEMSLAASHREILGQTQHALGRIEDGTYGVCESCGNPIGKARLLAFPRATLCVTCKQRQERR